MWSWGRLAGVLTGLLCSSTAVRLVPAAVDLCNNQEARQAFAVEPKLNVHVGPDNQNCMIIQHTAESWLLATMSVNTVP
jgi:hypothetical protein